MSCSAEVLDDSSKMTTPSRRVLMETCPLYYPFGNTRSTNVFENVREFFLPIFYIPTLTSLHSEEFHLPHPFDCTRPQLPLAPSQMAVDSCDESECQYTLKISIGGDQNVSGKFLNNKIEFDHFLQFVSQFLYTQVLK